MGRWCPQCRSEYVEGWDSCTSCGTQLVERRPPEPEPEPPERPDVSFTQPRPDHDDPWVPIWEGSTIDAEGLALALEDAHIPVNLGEALEVGHSRVEVPRSYFGDAQDVAAGRAIDWPSGVTQDLDGTTTWTPAVRAALALVAVGLIVMLVLLQF